MIHAHRKGARRIDDQIEPPTREDWVTRVPRRGLAGRGANGFNKWKLVLRVLQDCNNLRNDTLFSSQNIGQHRVPQVRRMEMESIAVSMFLR